MSEKNMDQNDLLQAGLLPEDPFEDCEPIETPPAPAGPLDGLALVDLLDGACERIKAREEQKEKPISTPWKSFNSGINGGLWPGLVVLTGNTGTGKTQWALQLALKAATDDHPVIYIGLELDRLGLVARLASLYLHHLHHLHPERATHVPHWSSLYLGKAGAIETLQNVRSSLVALPLYLVEADPGAWNPKDLESLLAATATKHPRKTPFVVVDFLQIVGGKDDNGRELELRQKIGQAAYTGRRMARKHKATVLLISSTARVNYKTLALLNDKGDDLEPGLSKGTLKPQELIGLGKESGEIEYAADLVLTMCRKPLSSEDKSPPVWLAVAKQRAGLTDWYKLTFDGNSFGESELYKEEGDNEDDF